MTTYLGKSCSFCLPRVPFVNCRQFMYLVVSLFGFEGRIWDLIVSVPDHCLSFYFVKQQKTTCMKGARDSRKGNLKEVKLSLCVKRSLVSDDQLIGKASYVTLIVETTQRYPLAVIDIDCPFYTGKTEALCMEDTLYNLVIGYIDGSKLCAEEMVG